MQYSYTTTSQSPTRSIISTTARKPTPLIDEEAAEQLGRRSLMMLDVTKRGHLEADEIVNAMRETYRLLGKAYDPSPEEIKQTIQLLDQNGDGRVTADDIEGTAKKYLLRPLENK